MGLTTLGLYGFSLWQGVPQASARTRTLAALGVEQIFHLWQTRIIEPGMSVPQNPTARRTAFLSAGLLLLSVYAPPLRSLFHLVPLQLVEWLLVLGFAWIAAPPPVFASERKLPAPHTKRTIGLDETSLVGEVFAHRRGMMVGRTSIKE